MSAFYVTMRRDSRQVSVLVGPFATRDVAEAWVDPARLLVQRLYPHHAFDVFGVARIGGPYRLAHLSEGFGFRHHIDLAKAAS